MSRDLTKEEQTEFAKMYGAGLACGSCGNNDVSVKIWEKFGSDAAQVGGDIGPTGIIGAIVACDLCDNAETIDRGRLLKAG